jgi:hypothetical protein
MRLPLLSAFWFSFSDWSQGAALGSFQSHFDVVQIALEHGLHTTALQWRRQPEQAMWLDLHSHNNNEKCICHDTIGP